MDDKIHTWMMTPEGIKALWDSIDSIKKELSWVVNWLAQTNVDLEQLKEKQPTIAQTMGTAPTEEKRWVAEVNTRLRILELLQSDHPTTKNGPVEHNSECAHTALITKVGQQPRLNQGKWFMPLECWNCRASLLYELILVPAVDQNLSTSVNQPSNPSVESSVEESAK